MLANVRELSSRVSVSVGAAFRADQGGPINTLGAHPLYGEGEAFVLPRGAGGRLPWVTQLDVRFGGQYRFEGARALDISLDIFNLTNNRAVLAVDQNYTFDAVAPVEGGTARDLPGLGVTPNATYRGATAYQLPLSAKLGARLSV